MNDFGMLDLSVSRTKFALQAVCQATVLAVEIQRKMVSEALTKDDRSPVTVADFAAQAVVGHLLDQYFPGESLVGEEQSDVLRSPQELDTLAAVTEFVNQVIPGKTPDQVCDLIDRGGDQPGSKFWTLDPIDGTKGFLRGAQYVTALAYIEDGELELGVLGCPNLNPDMQESSLGGGSLLIAQKGKGCWITRIEDSDHLEAYTRLTVSMQEEPEKARLLRSFESGHTNTDQIHEFQRLLGSKADPVRMDSQVKYALLASGMGEIYLRLLSPDKPDYKEKIWDQAAGSLIVEEAGGRVTDLDGKALDFSQGRTLKENRGICASNGRLHAKALEALHSVKA